MRPRPTKPSGQALIEAANDPVARVRVAALEGLARLKHDAQSEAIFRAAWANPKEAYGGARLLCELSTIGKSRTPKNS